MKRATVKALMRAMYEAGWGVGVGHPRCVPLPTFEQVWQQFGVGYGEVILGQMERTEKEAA